VAVSRKAPLSDYKVIDFTSVVAGPWCTRLLADCGAEVIKIESPGGGDVLRFSPPIAEGQSRVYAHFNCGKKNICIDLKSAQGIDVARKLIDNADIVVENFRPGVMKRLGLDYESVKGERTDLIYCSISGFGQTGLMASAPAYAPVLHALSGFDHAQQVAQREKSAPLSCGIMVADILAATYAFGAIQTAIIHKERFAEGDFIDVSLMDSMLTMVAIQTQEAQWPEQISSNVFHPVEGADGHVVLPLVNHRNFVEMFKAIGAEVLLKDPRFETLEGVMTSKDEILAVLASWAKPRNVENIVGHMQAAGLPCARYRSAAETLDDEHLVARGSFVKALDGMGPFTVVNAPFQTSAMSIGAQSHVSATGENTKEVLASIGMGEQEIADLISTNVIV
jgi:CoA:oxalate CoA-transferase